MAITNNWDIIGGKYIASAVKSTQYPMPAQNEIAFIGRSNVGKSSLINSITRHKGLARVSSTPGKTQTINFYELQAKLSTEVPERKSFHLVDLPGYGFAKTSKENKNQWSAFIGKYLEDSPNLQVVCQLIDIRHKPLDNDIACYHWLIECGRPVIVVLTKADKLSRNAAMSQKALFMRELGLREEQIMVYSATQPTMRGDFIARLIPYI